MIAIDKLWTKLEPMPENISSIKNDLCYGLAPNLPFFILDMDKAKKNITKKMELIDTAFQYSFVTADYGNGKSNLMKYLEYFFLCNKQYNIHVAYWRADVDKYDLILFLHYILQENFLDLIKSSLRNAIKTKSIQIESSVRNYSGSYSVLEKYVIAINTYIDNDEILDTLIALGTGKIYNKGSFDKLSLDKFTDYNRREVLVFFLNVLAASGHYIIFEIDELEKIQEKSKVRFNSLLTSYRELIDLSSDIKGHYIITAATEASGASSRMSLAAYNTAFERRISPHILQLGSITSISDVIELTKYLDELIQSNKSDETIKKIASFVQSKHFSNNNNVIQLICKKLQTDESVGWKEKMIELNLSTNFEETKKEIEENKGFMRINQKFFSNLENYVDILNFVNEDFEVKVQTYQTLLNHAIKNAQVFLFTGDVASNISRIKNVKSAYPNYELVIYRPESLDISFAILQEESIIVKEIVTYDPMELMTLLGMYYTYYTSKEGEIKELISLYTNGNL